MIAGPPYCVDGVGCEVTNSGQFVVVHKLGLPLTQRLVRRGCVVNLKYEVGFCFTLLLLQYTFGILIKYTTLHTMLVLRS